jgi:hypothetical protein
MARDHSPRANTEGTEMTHPHNDKLEAAACPFCADHDSLLIEHVEGTVVHPAYYVKCDNCGAVGPTTDKGNHVELWNRRAPPALDADGLPPLPEPKATYADLDDFGNVVIRKTIHYTAEQVRQAQRDAVAADRRARRPDGMSTALAEVTDRLAREAAENLSLKMELRALEAKLARQDQQPAQRASIDTAEFRKLLADAQGWLDGEPVMDEFAHALIAHIDAWGRAKCTAIPDGWKLVPIEPTEEMIQAACLNQTLQTYPNYEAWWNDHSSGISEKIRGYCSSDYKAMIAAAPSPAQQGKDTTK